ncbi:MAG: ABC transporter permease [Ilumatobacteraceae bacterium]
MSTETTPAPDAANAVRKPAGYFRVALGMGRTWLGIVLAGSVVLLALIGPWVASEGPTASVKGASPSTRDVPGTLFGVDKLSHDVWNRFLYGGRTILLMAFIATAVALILGALIGLLAGYSKGWLDTALMRTMDITIAFPSLLLVLVVFSTFDRTNWLVTVVVALTTTPRIARVVRGAVTPVVERDFVGAAEALGESRWHILRKELLPNVAAPLLVEASLRIAYSIGLIGAMGFLGIVPDLLEPNWGVMINENRGPVANQPWPVILPVIAIAVLTVGAGLIADGVTRATAGIDRARADA